MYMTYLKAFASRNASDINKLARNKMADADGSSDGKESILGDRELLQLPLHGDSLSSEMTDERLGQMLLLLVAAAELEGGDAFFFGSLDLGYDVVV